MKLTKYEHSCMVIEDAEHSLVIDPGNFTTDFVAPGNVVAVVVTHRHSDHFDPAQLAAIAAKNLNVLVIGPADVIDSVALSNKRAVRPGETVAVDGFTLEFFGGEHAEIAPNMPRPQNLGVLVNERFYYPGDSFAPANRQVDVLALPVAAPWLKLSESIGFFAAVKPRLAFPAHDAILSDIGKSLVDNMLAATAAEIGSSYQRLGEPLEF